MVVWSWVVSCVHCVKVTVRLAGSVGGFPGVEGHLEQWVSSPELCSEMSLPALWNEMLMWC